jgi:hypothetical protein
MSHKHLNLLAQLRDLMLQYFIHVCVCVCVRARARLAIHAGMYHSCACVFVCGCERVYARLSMLQCIIPACVASYTYHVPMSLYYARIRLDQSNF